jgi:hypothetical protein
VPVHTNLIRADHLLTQQAAAVPHPIVKVHPIMMDGAGSPEGNLRCNILVGGILPTVFDDPATDRIVTDLATTAARYRRTTKAQ